MFVSVTYLRIKNIFLLISFFYFVFKIRGQLKTSTGLLHYSLKGKGMLDYYTLSVWKSKEDMLSFRNSGEHINAMQKINFFAHTFSFVNFESNNIPTWEEALRKINN